MSGNCPHRSQLGKIQSAPLRKLRAAVAAIDGTMSAQELDQPRKQEKLKRTSRQMLGIANALNGMSCAEAGAAAGKERKALRDEVVRYYAERFTGLRDRLFSGRPPALSDDEIAIRANGRAALAPVLPEVGMRAIQLYLDRFTGTPLWCWPRRLAHRQGADGPHRHHTRAVASLFAPAEPVGAGLALPTRALRRMERHRE